MIRVTQSSQKRLDRASFVLRLKSFAAILVGPIQYIEIPLGAAFFFYNCWNVMNAHAAIVIKGPSTGPSGGYFSPDGNFGHNRENELTTHHVDFVV